MMADSLSITVITEPFISAKKLQDKRVDRATMWALREVARRVKREAGRAAPKVSGTYKRSIKSSRRLKPLMDGYSVTVGPRRGEVNPRGVPASVYAGKVEALHGPMKKGYDATIPEMAALHAKAWAKAMSR